jgi:hypothetical protein
LEKGKYAKTDTYVAHITCSDSPPSWFMATSKYFSFLTQNLFRIFHHFFRRVLFVTEISFLGLYEIDWKMNYVDLHEIPVIIPEKQAIQILLKVSE